MVVRKLYIVENSQKKLNEIKKDKIFLDFIFEQINKVVYRMLIVVNKD